MYVEGFVSNTNSGWRSKMLKEKTNNVLEIDWCIRTRGFICFLRFPAIPKHKFLRFRYNDRINNDISGFGKPQ